MESTSGHLTYQAPLSQIIGLEEENPCVILASPTGENYHSPESYDGF